MINKKLKVGNVPNLRFPEFMEEWETKKLGEIATFSKGKGISKSDIEENGIIECIRYGELYTHYREVINEIKSKTNVNPSTLVLSEKNDVIIPASGETTIDIATASCVLKSGIALGGDLNIIKTNINGIFLSYYLNSKKKMEIANLAQGISVVHLYSSQLASLSLSLPKLNEQNRISSFLALIDERIQTQNKIIEQLETLIKGLCQNLANNKQWEKQYLRNILTERKETNKDNLPIFSVSVSKGVINQIEYLGRSFASKNTTNYNVVHFGDVVYTKSPTGEFPYGIIKQSFISENVAVSPLYGVYEPKNVCIGNILHYYFNSPINANNYLHSLVQKGAKNTINITNQRFLDNTIFLPTDEKEVENIASLLNNIDQKIQTEEAILTQFENQKKYLLNQMFV
ncbi:restriction endonuclease subunit S [Elizabethkingia bruuniana]|uniref:Restriction endonuclease subunit S n=3 Tax=Weeksellaceae TaxID=2762318 RepID=A0A7T7V0C2_9FLAO|nr:MULTISPECIES: restriction endonuclease subunit S [Bacteroidota]QQN59521.1 restriction endonuclease subunit S [Elizabethkingia bruuniana]VEE10546.1 Type I restriction modification DNA specificity domain [Chryseobacterium gleum]